MPLLFYIVAIGYTIMWLAIWIIVLRHKNKTFDALVTQFEELETKHNALIDDYNKLEGRYEECRSIMEQKVLHREPTLSERGYLPN